MKELKTFEAAAKFIGVDPTNLPEVSMLPEKHQKAIIAFYKLSTISEAAWKLENKVQNWNDYNQSKYYGWFDMRSGVSSVGFSYFAYDDASASHVGSRLVFPSRKALEYVQKIHIELYRDLMVIE